MKTLKLSILDGLYTIHQLKPGAGIPKGLTSCPFYSLSGSSEELSIVAPEMLKVESETSESGWAAMRVLGKLDFAEVGILAELAGVLAKAGISIFAVSTCNTDYLLVKEASLKAAREALTLAGHKVSKPRAASPDEKSSMLKGSAITVLETQIPLIKKLLVEEVGPSTLTTLRSTTSMAVAVGGVYEFLPVAVRLVVNREIFVSFCVSNLDKILPQAPTIKTKKKK
jgi:hypothetical protein